MTHSYVLLLLIIFNLKKGKQTRATGVNCYVNISDELAGIKASVPVLAVRTSFKRVSDTSPFWPAVFKPFLLLVLVHIFLVAYQSRLAVGLRIQGLQ